MSCIVSSLEEREVFYKKNFSIEKVKKWFKKNGLPLPQLCALDAGTESGILKNRKWKGNLYYFPFNELKKQVKKYVPEDLYYDRNVYPNPEKQLKTFNEKYLEQELVFDIDCQNVKCKKCKTKICKHCINYSKEEALKLIEGLKKEGFEKFALIYSGAGYHVHVLDKKAFLLNNNERRKLVKKFHKYSIDSWVSEGNIELIRMPYSLNGIVSKKVMPASY